MRRTTAFSVALAALACALPVLPARAAEEDFQLWITESASAPLSSAVRGTLDLSQRFRENGNQLLTGGTVEFRLSRSAVVGGGAAYISTIGSADEFRPYQQLTFSYGPITLRTRLEERFFEHADRMVVRLRQRIGAALPVSHDLRAGLAGEVLYIARSRNSGQGVRGDQWRANATITRRMGDSLEGTLGYLAIFTPRTGAPDRLSHVAQVTLNLRR